MVLKNLLRRRGRTMLTVLGISIGVAAIIVLGALADGLEVGYGAVISGSKADLILSDPEAYDIIMSAVDEDIGETIRAMPEVEDVSGMMQGLVKAENMPYFFVFGYPEGSFALGSFRVVEGVELYSHEAEQMRGKPLLLGSAASEALSRKVGDTLRIGDTPFRVVGIYETGQAFEEGGAVLRMEDAQEVVGMPRQVSAFYIKLKEPGLEGRLRTRIERIYPDLSLSTAEDMAKQTSMADDMRAMMGGVAALAIMIGGVGMMNSQLMAVLERTREIGVLRAVGWRGSRVMLMILGESVLVGLVGGLLGTGLSWLILYAAGDVLSAYGTTTDVRPGLLVQAFAVVFTLGLVGGLYPAYRASRLQPVEALRYEGGSMGQRASRLPVGGMAIQNLWRRKGRTLLTLGMIGITVGAIMALNALLQGLFGMMGGLVGGSEVVLREADTADTSLSAIDQRIGDRIAAMPEVENVSGMLLTAITTEDTGIFMLLGFNPREAAIQEFRMVEGERLTSNRQIMIGRKMADAQGFKVGDTVSLNGVRYRVVGIYEHSSSGFELGGVITLRDAQALAGRPRKVTVFLVDLRDPSQAEYVVEEINTSYPEVHATLSGDFAEQMPDMKASKAMTDGVAVIAILVGGVGMMNTMLMAVLERTREIGVLRALGWRRRAILSLIVRESLALGVLGAVAGIGIAFGLAWLLGRIPFYGGWLAFAWQADVFAQSIGVAIGLGLIGGLYPAIRATRLQPIEALRYE